MRRLIPFIVIFIGICHVNVFAQQQTQYSQYMLNRYMMNPGVAGSENNAVIQAGYRSQWLGFKDAPNTIYLSGHTPVGKQVTDYDVKPLAHHGVGGYIIQDQTGPFTRSTAFLSYAYHLPLTKELTLSSGIFAGGRLYQINGNQLEYHDQVHGQTEPTAPASASEFVPDGGIGLWLYHDDYYVGVSSFQLFENEVGLADASNDAQRVGRIKRHYFGTAGYRIALTDTISIIPSVMVKGNMPAPVSFDVNAKLKYKGLGWVGFSYRHEDAVIGLLGFTVSDLLDIGYAYDYTLSEMSDYSSGSHEIVVGVRFSRVKTVEPPSQFY